jgi:simple sugar transport system permease protein
MTVRLVPHPSPSRLRLALVPVWALLATFVLSAGLIRWANAPVGRSCALLVEGGFGSAFAWSETLARATPLVLTGLSVAVAFRARLINIGAEGQFYAGALAAVAVGSHAGSAAWLLPATLLSAALAGALWLLGPALLKIRLGADEVVTTLLLNFITLLLVSLLLDGPLRDPLSLGWPQSVPLSPNVSLPPLIARPRVGSGLLLAAGAAAAVWLIQRYSVFGYEVRAVGAGLPAARFAGVPVGRVVVATAVLSGGLSGLAGAVELAGRASYVTQDMSPGYGYSGIVVAMLAGLDPLVVIPSAVLVAGLTIGADSMSRAVAVPTYLADVMVALALLSILVSGLLARSRIVRG